MKLPVLNCDNCGACCMEMRTPPFVLCRNENRQPYAVDEYSRDELQRLLSAPAEAQEIYTQRLYDDNVPEDAPCVWLDLETRRCRYYEHRPDICQDFEVGCEACGGWREQYAPKETT